MCVHHSESSGQSPDEGIPIHGMWPAVSSPALQFSLSVPFSLLPSLSFLSSPLQLSPPLSYPAFASFALLPFPQPSQLLSLDAAARVPLHHPPTWLVPEELFWVGLVCALPPSAQQHRAGCYFRHTQGLTQRSRDLPAPKLGLAVFHRHRRKCMSTTYRHTHTAPFQHT